MLGLGSIAKKVFGTPNDRRVKAVRPLVEKINALEPQFRALTDAGIRVLIHMVLSLVLCWLYEKLLRPSRSHYARI